MKYFLLIIGTILFLISELFEKEKKTGQATLFPLKKLTFSGVILLVTGVVLSSLGVYQTYIDEQHLESKSKRDSINFQNIIVNQQRQLASADTLLNEQNKVLAVTNSNNAILNEQIKRTSALAKLNTEFYNKSIGGDSFCEIIAFNLNDQNCELLLLNRGKFPVYDIGVLLNEYSNFGEANKILHLQSSQELSQLLKQYNVPALKPRGSTFLGGYKFKTKDEKKIFIILFTQRNASFKQELIVKKRNGIWLTASRVLDQNGKVLFKEVAKGFIDKTETNNSIWK